MFVLPMMVNVLATTKAIVGCTSSWCNFGYIPLSPVMTIWTKLVNKGVYVHEANMSTKRHEIIAQRLAK